MSERAESLQEVDDDERATRDADPAYLTPEYVGTLEIMEARPNEAVGRFRPAQPGRSKVQVHDEVASNILPGGGVR